MSLSKSVVGVVGLVVCILASQVVLGHEANSARTATPIVGYLDRATGTFHPIAQTEDFDSESVASINPQAGTVVVNITMTIRSGISTSSPITCHVSTSVFEVSLTTGAFNFRFEDSATTATRNGNTARCTVTIPYSWVIVNPATTKLSINYSLLYNRSISSTTGVLSRLSIGSVATIPIPAEGATTTHTVNAVL